jgi:outer membrane receptor protein involved in Fe transport
VDEIAGGKPLAQGSPPNGFPVSTLQQVEQDFTNVWSPKSSRAIPNGSFALTYGDELRMFGRPLGFVQSLTMSRSYEQRAEVMRFTDDGAVPDAQYDMERSTESVQLGANASLSYRLTPANRLSVRGLYTNKADDEVLTYTGLDPDAGQFYRRASKLMYIQRQIAYGTVEGQHDLRGWLPSTLDWKFTRSGAHRQQPDKREVMYLRVPIDETNPGNWGLAVGRREYGDLLEDGWGTTVKLEVPYRLASLGQGRVTGGFDRQSRSRDNGYRRFDFIPSQLGQDVAPESSYSVVNEVTSSRDNYDASQLIEAFFLSMDVPMGRRLRGNLGLRREFGSQNVLSRDLFNPGFVLAEGGRSDVDWLAGANLTWSVLDHVNIRAAASRTLNRPDMDDLSPLPALDFVGDKIRIGNPTLQRAHITNYDLRAEAFPGPNELFAAGVFYKDLDRPIEPALFGTNGQLGIRPENSVGGRNMGVELEARAGLGRLVPGLRTLSVNTNLSFINSKIRSSQTTDRGNSEHPLVGQAPMMFNLGLTWTSGGGMNEVTLLSATVGERLKELNQTMVNAAGDGIPNLYTRGITTLDLTASFTPFRGGRLRFAAGNLLDKPIQEFVGPIEMRRYATGRTYSLALSVGS